VKRSAALLLWSLAFVFSASYAQDGRATAEANNAPSVAVRREGGFDAIALAGKRVYVDFKNSHKLAAVLVDRVQAHGAVVVATASEADVRLEGQGAFNAAREYGNRRAHADVGEVFEQAGTTVQTTGVRRDVMLSHGGAALNAAQATVAANLLSAFADASGFRGWFNTIVAGDPDGFCFRGCEYKQAATITLSLRQANGAPVGSLSVVASTLDKRLLPLPLIEAALKEALGYLSSSPAAVGGSMEYEGATQ
jgi:hypothetical protein